MKTLRLSLMLLMTHNGISAVYSANTFGGNEDDLDFSSFIKSSSRMARGCKKLTNDKKVISADLIKDYINEVDYRCADINRSMEHNYSECKLTLYRLKSDLMNCESKDYYFKRIQQYLKK